MFAVVTAKPRRPRALGHELLAAFDARTFRRFAILPNLATVFGVPLQTFFGCVPRFGQRSCVFCHLPCALSIFGSPVRSAVLFVRQTLQIGDVVVECVPVLVVDVMSFEDRSVVMLPNRLVKPTYAVFFALGANEVVAQFELRRVWITTIWDPVEDDTFGGFLKIGAGSGHVHIMPNAT